MKTRAEIEDAVKLAMSKSVNSTHSLAILMAAQIELLADIRELLTGLRTVNFAVGYDVENILLALKSAERQGRL